MSDRDIIHALLGEFGRTIGLNDLAFDETGYCILLFGDTLVVNTEIDQAPRHTGRDEPTVQQALLQNPCFNIAVAGAILRVYLAETRAICWQPSGTTTRTRLP